MNGVIWNKVQGTFVPIFSIPAYASIQRQRLEQSRALEIHDFQLQNLTLASFQEPKFFEFHDNDKKISGLCGDLWNLLSESLNFTLQPVRANVDGLGAPEKDYTYKRGLLGIIFRNETNAIPKIETYSTRLAAVDFTMPLWMNRHRLYIRYEGMYDNTWMVKVFSWDLWCVILIMHILLSICSFWSQNLTARMRYKYENTSFGEHLFYNFGMLCNQSYTPVFLNEKSRILETSLGLFSFVMYMAFSTVLFTCMTKRVFIPPFDSLESLVIDTKYSIVNLKGSIGDIAFKISPTQPYALVRTEQRAVVASTIEEMFKMVCSSIKQKYALFQDEDEHKAIGQITCRLRPIGESYLNMWVASGIAKNFKYKRTIDIGILRLKEVGLWDILMERWLTRKTKQDYNINMPEAIGIDQVSLVIAVICCGAIMALIILVIENIVFIYKIRQS